MEILAPAGNREKMEAGLRFGADACYMAGKGFGMRTAADNFSEEELDSSIKYAHRLGKKIYITVNVMPHGYEYEELERYLHFLDDVKPDGLIIADLGVLSLANEITDIPKHISTQASIVSARAAEEYRKLGASRVVLARELSLEEIKRLRRETTKELELEAFVHGSMCISYSGRCLLSNHFTGRDANRGACTQPCRWNYKLYEIEEDSRPGERIPIEETDRGSFVMSSKDMCMIEHVPELIEAGIDSFKIEGRMKSAYYTAVTSNAYRMAVDSYFSGNYKYDPKWLEELESVSHREYYTGFYFDDPAVNANTVTQPGYVREKSYVGVVESCENGRVTVIQRNKINEGDEVELVSPGKTGMKFTANALLDENGEKIESAPHPKMRFSFAIPFGAKPGDMIRK